MTNTSLGSGMSSECFMIRLGCENFPHPALCTTLLSKRQSWSEHKDAQSETTFLVEGLSLGPNDCNENFQNCFSVKKSSLFRFHYMRLLNALLSEIITPITLY